MAREAKGATGIANFQVAGQTDWVNPDAGVMVTFAHASARGTGAAPTLKIVVLDTAGAETAWFQIITLSAPHSWWLGSGQRFVRDLLPGEGIRLLLIDSPGALVDVHIQYTEV